MSDRTEFDPFTLDRFAFCDPAGGRRSGELKRLRARSAICVIGLDSQERIFVLSAWAARATTDQLVDRIFQTNDQWKPRLFGVEANAMQALFADTLLREARHRGLRLPLLPVQQPTRIDKEFRIRSTIQPVLSQGRLFVHDSQLELLNELQSFPTGQTVDLVDALASAVRMAPSKLSKQQQHDDEASLVQYLRKSGLSPSEIERRLSSNLSENMIEKMNGGYG